MACTRRFPTAERAYRLVFERRISWWERDAALLIEGFQTPIGSSFQMDALRMVTQVPVRAAINTPLPFRSYPRNSFYGGAGCAIWAHAKAASAA